VADIHLDDSVLSTLRDVMEDEYPTLLEVFLKDSDERIHALHQWVSPHDAGADPPQLDHLDLKALGMTAHSFKGSSSNMGAVQLADLCRQLEELARGTDPITPLSLLQLTQRIDHEYQLVRRLFDAELQLLAVRH
jgi:HPt (histidine-containing phosphotransfer) domain-containing protein